jgi:hypothetical protein
MVRKLFVLLLISCVAGLSACNRPINREAEKRVKAVLPDLLGPARQYSVRVDGGWDRTVRGKLRKVAIDGYDVELSTGLVVDQLRLDLDNVDVDLDRRRVRNVGTARFTAMIGKKTLDEFLAGESPEGETLRDTRVTLEDNNRVTIASKRVVLGVGVPFTVSGQVSVGGTQRIGFDAQGATVATIGVPGFVVDFLKNRFVSGVELRSLAFPVTLMDVQTRAGLLILSGTVDTTFLVLRTQEPRP